MKITINLGCFGGINGNLYDRLGGKYYFEYSLEV